MEPTTIILICSGLLILAGLAKGAQDAISFHWDTSFARNWSEAYWRPSVSWKRKWKNGDKRQGEAFWGSSRWFVMFTDGWHLLDYIRETAFEAIAAILIVLSVGVSWLWFVPILAAVKLINSAGFHSLYTLPEVIRK